MRLAAALELLYATGMRVSELVALPLATVLRDPQAIMVRGNLGAALQGFVALPLLAG